jgi:hypothetical protein
MKSIFKPAIVLGIAGALALASMTPSQARVRPWVAAGIGLAAGAAIGAAAANANGYYGNGYAYSYGPQYGAYAYDPYYAAAPYVAAPYYAPAPAYMAPDYGYPSSSSDQRYLPQYHGYDSNYIGPTRERQLQGRDY